MKRDTQIKLSKLVGMLGAEHDNEALNAVRRIRELLKAEGLSMPDLQRLVLEGKVTVVIKKVVQGADAQETPWEGQDEIKREKPQEQPHRHNTDSHHGPVYMADIILKNAGNKLRTHEKKFVQQMKVLHETRSHFQMSEKQSDWFSYLFAKYS